MSTDERKLEASFLTPHLYISLAYPRWSTIISSVHKTGILVLWRTDDDSWQHRRFYWFNDCGYYFPVVSPLSRDFVQSISANSFIFRFCCASWFNQAEGRWGSWRYQRKVLMRTWYSGSLNAQVRRRSKPKKDGSPVIPIFTADVIRRARPFWSSRTVWHVVWPTAINFFMSDVHYG